MHFRLRGEGVQGKWSNKSSWFFDYWFRYLIDGRCSLDAIECEWWGWGIKILVSCWGGTFRHTNWCIRWQQAPRRLPWHWKKHSGKGRSLLASRGGPPFSASTGRLSRSTSDMFYHFILVAFRHVDDMPEGRDHVNVDASKSRWLCTRLRPQSSGMTLSW